MSDDRLYDLVIEWDERRQRGEEISPELLCKDQPELLDELKESIASVIASDWMFESDDEDEDVDLVTSRAPVSSTGRSLRVQDRPIGVVRVMARDSVFSTLARSPELTEV